MVNAYRITRTVATVAMPGVAIVGAGLFVVPPAAPWPRTVHFREIQLADTADSALGDGTALVFGDGGVSIPPPQYLDAADTLYLHPLGSTGAAQSSFLTLEAYPFTGPKSLEAGTSGGSTSIMVLGCRRPNSTLVPWSTLRNCSPNHP
jgi:hypothetical protein